MWYNYDGLGKRRNKLFADPDDLHWYRWAGWSVLSEYDTTGASGWEVPAAAARVDVAGLAERGAGAAYAYRLHDHLGSVRGLLGASKAPLARYAYAPYGELNHGAGRPLRRGFTGHHWDAESGMYYAPFRYYMPGAGRWLSRDPIGFGDGLNLYGYVHNNPVRNIDLLGLYFVVFCRDTNRLHFYSSDGKKLVHHFYRPAHNNVTRNSRGPWPKGIYEFSYWKDHPENTTSYGNFGIFIFDVPGRTGMGVHSGRDNPAHPTLGCIRTNDVTTCLMRWLDKYFDSRPKKLYVIDKCSL